MKLVESKKECQECGACVQACPLNEVDKDFIVYKILLDNMIDFDIWTRCCSCFLCEENCPIKLSPREEIFRKRRDSKNQKISKRIETYFKNIVKNGFVFKINNDINDERSNIGLFKIDIKRVKDEIELLFR